MVTISRSGNLLPPYPSISQAKRRKMPLEGMLPGKEEKMRAWLMDSYQGVEKLRLDVVPDPPPGSGQVVLKILYAALIPRTPSLPRRNTPPSPSFRTCSDATAWAK